jgi:hypothetical protein
MAITGSGQVKLSDLYTEYEDGTHSSQEIQLSDFHDKGNAPASGEIQIATDFYGTSNVTYTVATGGTITTYTLNSVNYKVHTFTSGGTFAVSSVGTDATIACLVVGGGGGAGAYGANASRYGGGGGAGGMEYYDSTVTGTSGSIGRGPSKTITAQNYTIYVGSGGGGGGSSGGNHAGSGGNGSFIRLADGSTYLVIAGGGGGGFGDSYAGSDGASSVFGGLGGGASNNSHNGGDGGSGGGGMYGSWSANQYGPSRYYNSNTSNNTFTSTTPIQGYAAGHYGATGVNASGSSFVGGGGGGAESGGSAGGWASTTTAGRGGSAHSNTIRTGSAVYYATGGGSRAGYTNSGVNKQGVNRPSNGLGTWYTGAANTGDAGDNNGAGYAGGSGIVVIRYVVA